MHTSQLRLLGAVAYLLHVLVASLSLEKALLLMSIETVLRATHIILVNRRAFGSTMLRRVLRTTLHLESGVDSGHATISCKDSHLLVLLRLTICLLPFLTRMAREVSADSTAVASTSSVELEILRHSITLHKLCLLLVKQILVRGRSLKSAGNLRLLHIMATDSHSVVRCLLSDFGWNTETFAFVQFLLPTVSFVDLKWLICDVKSIALTANAHRLVLSGR